MKFNFTGLKDIYQQALESDGKSLAFETTIGKGHFMFMMFLSKEDGGDRDILFLFLRHVNRLLRIKTYGSHRKGDFKVFLSDADLRAMVDELQLCSGEGHFRVECFLDELNNKIPSHLSLEESHQVLRKNVTLLPPQVVEDVDKTVLLGVAKLPEGRKPQDKTLRKLYLFADGSYAEKSQFIMQLKSNNYTVRWTSEENREKAASINDFLNSAWSECR